MQSTRFYLFLVSTILLAFLLITSMIGNAETNITKTSDTSDEKDVITGTDVLSGRLKSPLYDIEPSPVHQWIALQAFLKLESSDLKSEIADYLPTDAGSDYYSGDAQGISCYIPSGWRNSENLPYDQSTALIEGVWEEDKGAYIPGTPIPLRSVVHFWNPEGEYNAGLDLSHLGYGIQRSALEAAQAYFGGAVAAYGFGDRIMAYYWLGRTAHLLMDLGVPAHAHLDMHIPYVDGDEYEAFVSSWEFHYKRITSTSNNTSIPPFYNPPGADYPRYTPPEYNNNLTNLLYSLARISNQFDSDDEDGRLSEYGDGKYRSASNQLDVNKLVSEVYIVRPLWMGGGEIRLLNDPTDYSLVICAWSHDASIIYSHAFYSEINNKPEGVRVYYTDGSSRTFYDLYENNVPWAVCGELYQPLLQSRAIGDTRGRYMSSSGASLTHCLKTITRRMIRGRRPLI